MDQHIVTNVNKTWCLLLYFLNKYIFRNIVYILRFLFKNKQFLSIQHISI